MRNLPASSLEKALASGQPVITAEITPPLGGDPSHALEMAEALRGQVQAFNVTDGSRAVMGMSSLALCCLLLERGLEPILSWDAATAIALPCKLICWEPMPWAFAMCCV